MTNPSATYQVDSRWKITRASDAFCRAFRCTEASLLGRDVRDLLREDWRPDFRAYVARALVGVGDADVTLPMAAPCGELAWYKHKLEAIIEEGVLVGYRASIAPHIPAAPKAGTRWWNFRPAAPTVWNFDERPLARELVGT